MATEKARNSPYLVFRGGIRPSTAEAGGPVTWEQIAEVTAPSREGALAQVEAEAGVSYVAVLASAWTPKTASNKVVFS